MTRLLGALCALALAANAWGIELAGTVVGITDGDTLTVLDAAKAQHKIRLMGIDAPERKQAFGYASRQHLSKLAFRRTVVIEYYKIDLYGRIVGRVTVNGVDINLAQVEAGLAWHYAAYAREQRIADRKLYSDTQIGAKAARRGLWHDPAPVAPWVFRHTVKTVV